MSNNEKLKILHVDDYPDFQRLFGLKFRKFFDITSAVSGTEALKLVSEHSFDAAFLDYEMPEMNGLDLLIEIKNISPDLPVIFYTSQGNEEVAREAFLNGADDYFVKHKTSFAEREKIVNSVRKAIAVRSARLEEKKSREKYQYLIENLNDAIAVYEAWNDGEDFIFTDLNKTCENMEKLKKEEIIGKKVTEIFPRVEEFGLLSIFRKVWKTGERAHFPLTLYQDNRITGWRESIVYRLPSKEIVAVYNDHIINVSETNEASKYLKTIENTTAAIHIIDLSGKMIYANRAMEKLFGYERGELLGKSHSILSAGVNNEEVHKEIMSSLSEKGYWEGKIHNRRKDGSTFITMARATTHKDEDGNVVSYLSSQVELVNSQLIQEELEENKNMLSKIAENYPNSYVSIIDRNMNILFSEGQEFRKKGLNPKLLEGISIKKIFKDQTELIENYYRKTFEGEEQRFEFTYVNDNNSEYQLYKTVPLYNRTGKITRILVVVENITERKLAEMKLRESEELFRSIVENSVGVVFRIDIETEVFLYVSPSVTNVLGYTPDQLKGKMYSDIVYKDDTEKIQKFIEKVAREGKASEFEYRVVRKDGKVVTLVTGVAIIKDEKGRSIISGISYDISRRREMEKELRRKNTELEEFAHRITADVKAPLGLISAYTDLIRNQPEAIEGHLHRIDQIVEKLLYFINNVLELAKSGLSITQKEDVDLALLLKKVYAYANPGDFPTELKLNLETKKVYGAPSSLEKAFLNVIENSFKFRDVKKEKLIISVSSKKKDNIVEIYLGDNGSGIEEKNHDLIFRAGAALQKTDGTGFGLTIVKKIVEAHGGAIRVFRSAIDRGTEFLIRLPEK